MTTPRLFLGPGAGAGGGLVRRFLPLADEAGLQRQRPAQALCIASAC